MPAWVCLSTSISPESHDPTAPGFLCPRCHSYGLRRPHVFVWVVHASSYVCAPAKALSYQPAIDFSFSLFLYDNMPSVLWRCWLDGRKGIRPVKTEWWGTGMVVCLEQGADLHMAQLMPLPLTVSCFSKIQIGFTFLVPAHLGIPGKRAVKRACV